MNGDGKNYEILRNICAEIGTIDYLEIGVQEGGSAEAVFSTERIRSAILIDTWGKEYGGTGRGNPLHVESRLRHYPGQRVFITVDSKLILPQLRGHFDLIFIDGDHSAEGAYLDIINCVSLLRKEGAIVVDDINHPQHTYIRKIVEDVAKSLQMSVQFFDDAHEGVAVMRLEQ